MHTPACYDSGKSSDKGLLTLHWHWKKKKKIKFVLLKVNLFYEWKPEIREQNQPRLQAVLEVMALLHTHNAVCLLLRNTEHFDIRCALLAQKHLPEPAG